MSFLENTARVPENTIIQRTSAAMHGHSGHCFSRTRASNGEALIGETNDNRKLRIACEDSKQSVRLKDQIRDPSFSVERHVCTNETTVQKALHYAALAQATHID